MDVAKKKSIAALSSVIWSAILTAMKFVVGVMTGSLGLISEALHSALDLVAAGGTLYAVKVSEMPADDEHPYGHGKVENLMALGETLLLLATAAWVIKEAFGRLLSDDPAALHVETSIWAFAVIVISIIVDVSRARMLNRVAKDTKSAALEADAAHFASDIWSSGAVLVGITGVAVAHMTVENSWLHWLLIRADVLGSLVVAIVILGICKKLGFEAIGNLMDRENGETNQKIRRIMAERMPAYTLHRLRVREVGNKCFVEMVVLLPKELHVDTAHGITQAIEALVEEVAPGAETLLHVEPADVLPDTPEFIIRRIALAHRLGVHGVVMLHSEQGFLVTADLELPKEAKLESWLVAVKAFQHEVRHQLHADQVVVHLEPNVREIPNFKGELPQPEEWHDLVRQAMVEMGAPLPNAIQLFTRGNRNFCIISIPMEPQLTVEESHARLTYLNKALAQKLPPIARIMVSYSED